MPQLQEFQRTGRKQYNDGDEPGFSFRKKEKEEKTPEYLIP